MKSLIAMMIITFYSYSQSNIDKVIAHARWQTTQLVRYDGKYYKIDYPNGDVPANIGVCTDVIIRAYRAIGMDLQKLVHEDIVKYKSVYDKRKFYRKETDSNIDHRRTFNLRTYFTRQGASKPVTNKESDYLPGDIVFWDVAAGHVGIVVDVKVPRTNRYYVVHNICCGPKMEDFLFAAKIIDHYRWRP